MRQTVASGVKFAHKKAQSRNSLDIQLKVNGIPQKLRMYCKKHINITRLSAPNFGFTIGQHIYKQDSSTQNACKATLRYGTLSLQLSSLQSPWSACPLCITRTPRVRQEIVFNMQCQSTMYLNICILQYSTLNAYLHVAGLWDVRGCRGG